MALINCPECGTEISQQAITCPKCGHPINQLPPQRVYTPDDNPLTRNRGCLDFIVIAFIIGVIIAAIV